jgi:general secretion pathway protein D
MRNLTKILIAVFIFSLILLPNSAAPAEQEDSNNISVADTKILLNFKDATLETILEYLSEVAGLVVVADEGLTDRLTVISRQSLNVDEAISLINTILKEKGYAAVRMGRTLKIVTLAEAKKMNIPVRSGIDPEKIVESDDLVTHVIPIRYANAARLREDLASLVPTYADLAANEDSNVLILTATTADIKRFVEIVNALDTHLAAVAEVRVYRLKYANATNVAELINTIFEQQQQSSSSSQQMGGPFGAMREFMRRGGRDSQDTGSQETTGPRTNVSAAADERTNTVVVSGPSDVLKVIDGVIKDLDSKPGEELTVFTYHLKNADAENLVEVLNNLYTQMSSMTTGQTAGTRTGGGTTGRGGFMGMGMGTTSTQSLSDLLEQVYFEADTDTNALLVMATPKNWARIKEILDDLDKPVPQVLIKVLLAEVTHSDSLDLGIEFSMLNMRSDGDSSLFSTDFDLVSKGLILRTIEGEVDVALHALEKDGKLDILSRPYILTSNNQTATITVGEEVPFIRDTRLTDTGQTINTIEYEDIGIILEVTPHINPDGLVIMDVSPEISATTADTVPISETVNAAVFAKRSSVSRVSVHDGQTIVIGGLVKDQLTESVEKVPLLGDIPILGAAFRNTEKDKEKTELLIFLTPYVVTRPEELQQMSESIQSESQLVPNAVAPGVFEKHMSGMQKSAQDPNTRGAAEK